MRILIIVLLVLSAGLVHASIEWAQTRVELQVHPAQQSEVASFIFTNTGEKAISLGAVKVSCGCLAPKIQKRTYEPGESGALAVRFDLTNRTGPQHKKLTVTTSDGIEHKLVVDVDIPELYKVSPVMMKWVKGSAKKIKTAKLTNRNQQPVHLLSATSSDQAFTVELKTVRKGYEYEVAVTPKPTASNARSVIRIQPEVPPGQHESKIIKLYAHVE